MTGACPLGSVDRRRPNRTGCPSRCHSPRRMPGVQVAPPRLLPTRALEPRLAALPSQSSWDGSKPWQALWCRCPDHPPSLLEFAFQSDAAAARLPRSTRTSTVRPGPAAGVTVRLRGRSGRGGTTCERAESGIESRSTSAQPFGRSDRGPPRKHPVRVGRDPIARGGCSPCHP